MGTKIAEGKRQEVKLSPRLQVIADKVPQGSKIADIGTDHAYIPIFLTQKGIATYSIASDVRKGPVQKAQQNVKDNGLSDKIDVRLGNGLEKVKAEEVDTVVITGMGGVLITEILDNCHELLKTIKRLILQPMIGQEEVRMWLERNEFAIVDEELAAEGDKLYNIIVAEHGIEKIDKNIYYYVGKKLIEKKDPLLHTLLNAKIHELHKIINQLSDSDSPNAEERLKECKASLLEYQELLQQSSSKE